MSSSLPTAGLINIWINKLLVTKKQLPNFEKEQEIILILSKGSFTDNWGLIKENVKVRGGPIEILGFSGMIASKSVEIYFAYSKTVCLNQW